MGGRVVETSGRGDAPAVAVDGLKKRFGSGDTSVTAVDEVSFSIPPGVVVGLLGPNGAGKTTTIKSILGMILPDAGTVRINGTDVYADPQTAYRQVDAMLEGARNDYWRLTVRENLRYFATIGGTDPDTVADRHERLLDRLDLLEQADTPVRELSRGMKQKVSLASVLATDAAVVFLDEPTLGLDVESSLHLRRELGRIVRDRDLTVVLSSHDMEVIEAVCDRVIVMRDGSVVADATVDRLLNRFDMRGLRVVSPNIDATVRRAIARSFDIEHVDHRQDRTELTVAVDSEDVYALIDVLREQEVRIEEIETVSPGLDDAFVRLTGGPPS